MGCTITARGKRAAVYYRTLWEMDGQKSSEKVIDRAGGNRSIKKIYTVKREGVFIVELEIDGNNYDYLLDGL